MIVKVSPGANEAKLRDELRSLSDGVVLTRHDGQRALELIRLKEGVSAAQVEAVAGVERVVKRK